MTYEEMLKLQKKKVSRSKPNNEEHRIQCACVKWFRYQYPSYAKLLYAIPNGSRRDAITGKLLKDEGVVRGVSDLNLDIPNRFYHGLRIEMKTPTGTQSKEQKEFQKEIESRGFKYVICRSLNEFIKEITIYTEAI
jgi:hypothetical protein